MNSKKELRTISHHPILEIPIHDTVEFFFDNQPMIGFTGMMLSSALIMNGIHIFGHHPKDHAPQGIFCANGQCSQCMVIIEGKSVKSCMIPVKAGMYIKSCNGLPTLPASDDLVEVGDPEILEIEVLVIGAGPAGLSATKILADYGVKVLLVDDKDRTGGKLVLQTHKFFGSQEDVYAGKRGIEIGEILGEQVKLNPKVTLWLNSTALAVFSDGVVGVLKDNSIYSLIKPQRLLITTGAREKMLVFPGNTLPGVYGAGAFQTLVNRDLVKASEKIFIVGGGNVGLIAGYHAIQAEIEVVGLIEALPKCGGYHVHESKLRRLGVPIHLRHTILSANGTDHVKSITIAQLDDNWKPVEGTEKTFECDTVLIAVGLSPVDEFYEKAKSYNIPVWTAGDAQEIAEASAAIFTGRVEAAKILADMNITTDLDLKSLEHKAGIMKAHPPAPMDHAPPIEDLGIFPVFRCHQEIPCNPCSTVCPRDLIHIDGEITSIPYFQEEDLCIGCGKCVAVCPGLAISVVDYRKDPDQPTVIFPYEVATDKLLKGQKVVVIADTEIMGETVDLGEYEVKRAWFLKDYPKTQLVAIQLPKDIAKRAASLRTIIVPQNDPLEQYTSTALPDDAIVCRCERVTAGEIREWIEKGITDVNQLKAVTRAGMGSCGAKTCSTLVERLIAQELKDTKILTKGTKRPLFVEVLLGDFAHVNRRDL
jgi:NADPH-dependent 2,4-dienoyl-CoA reductase/sulfur reductase-like enzyme/Fe-S-cluster-containing hydrogenase component 2/bacterioferritin-associated ferredoxin